MKFYFKKKVFSVTSDIQKYSHRRKVDATKGQAL
jgi:hypothetical protein